MKIEEAKKENVAELKVSNQGHQSHFETILQKWLTVSIQHKEKSQGLETFKRLAYLPHEWFKLTNYLTKDIRDQTHERLKECKAERNRRFYTQLRGWEELIKDFDSFPLLATAFAIDWGTTAVKNGYFYKLWIYMRSRWAGYGEMEKQVYFYLEQINGFQAHNPDQKTAWEKFLGAYQTLALGKIEISDEEKQQYEKDAQEKKPPTE